MKGLERREGMLHSFSATLKPNILVISHHIPLLTSSLFRFKCRFPLEPVTLNVAVLLLSLNMPCAVCSRPEMNSHSQPRRTGLWELGLWFGRMRNRILYVCCRLCGLKGNERSAVCVFHFSNHLKNLDAISYWGWIMVDWFHFVLPG